MKEMELETLDPVNLKYIFIAGLSEDATRDQIEEAYFGSSSQETYNAYEIQNFSISSFDVCSGEISYLQYDHSDMMRFLNKSEVIHLLIISPLEKGDYLSFVVPDFRIIGWEWSTDIDDLVASPRIKFKSKIPKLWRRVYKCWFKQSK